MAKHDINRRTGKYQPPIAKQMQDWLAYDCYRIDQEIKRRNKAVNPPVQNKGIRGEILDIYRKTYSIDEVYNALDEINKRLKTEAFSRKIVDSWLNEEFGISNKEKEKGIDDGDAR